MKKLIILLLLSNCSFAQQTKRKLIWEENFDGKTLNEKVWNIEIGDGCPNCGWGNNERQLYTKDNHKLVDGKLIITAKKDGDKYKTLNVAITQDQAELVQDEILRLAQNS